MKDKFPIFSSLIRYYRTFYRYTGNRINWLFVTVLSAGIFEGFGISAVIPLLSFQDSGQAPNGFVRYFYGILDWMGLGVSLASILFMIVGLFVTKGVCMILITVISAGIKTHLEKSLRQSFCLKYTEADYTYFISRPFGYFNNIISTEVGNAVSGLNNFINVIVTLTYIGVYVSAAFLMNPELTLVVIGASLILFFLMRRLPRLLQKLSVFLADVRGETQSLIIQKLYNYKYLKATGGFGAVLAQINAKLEENRKGQFKNEVYNDVPQPFVEVFTVIALSLLIWYYVGTRDKEISEILVLLIFFWKAIGRTLSFQTSWQRFSSYIGAIKVIDDENLRLDAHTEHQGDIALGEFNDAIRLRNVHFAYDSNPVLTGVNLKIPKNRSIGIVGHSGAGKTTLFDIIVGLIFPQSGTVSIDGVNYRDLNMGSLRKMVGYVTQDPITFNDTLANNISLWDRSGTQKERDDRIRKAAQLANCTEFIKDAEQGFETVIGDKGVKLSGGQRQRIAIAREIYKNSEIMIFDEATSALDTESEQYIQQSIQKLQGNRTLILIAHRLSTIKNCDYIYVLSGGRVVEEGDFHSLWHKEGSLFQRMCQAQKM